MESFLCGIVESCLLAAVLDVWFSCMCQVSGNDFNTVVYVMLLLTSIDSFTVCVASAYVHIPP